MGREIRRVPQDWEHPRNEKNHHKPLLDCTYFERLKEHFCGELPWYIRHPRHLREWFETWPDRKCCRPRWHKDEATHYQIYETVSEGTPVSPIFASLDKMKDWLIKEGYSEYASQEFVKTGWAPSMVFSPTTGISGLGIHSLDTFRDRKSNE